MTLSRTLNVWLIMLFCAQTGLIGRASAQDCTGFSATATPTESRCTATGTMQFTASGGSGTYNYRVNGPVSSGYTSSSTITGLPPGTYAAYIKDIVTGCVVKKDSTLVVAGSYQAPRFGISETDVTCFNGNDGTISLAGLTNGRAPFTFQIIAPSPMAVGSSNGTGYFAGLMPGSYFIQMMDSCGGIQTRNTSIHNYTWSITSAPVTLVSCTSYSATMNLMDSKGNTNSSGTAFNGYKYGYVNAPGDTVWYTTSTFPVYLLQKRSLTLVAKDICGNVQTKIWNNTVVPALANNVTITNLTCNTYDVAINGQTNLTNPVFCLTDGSGNPVSGQPCNGTGTFTGLPYGPYCITMTNTCYDTVIKKCFNQAQQTPAVSGTVSLTNYTCTTVDAAVTGQQHLYTPQYCLRDVNGNTISCNSTGLFPGLPYGSYTIVVVDGCTGHVFYLPFTATEKTKAVAANATISGYTCTDFDVTITGQSNLTNPQYCLVDSVGNPIICNLTGVFNNLPYGSYCINVTDACADTTITRCFTAVRPVPGIGNPTISNKNCTGFSVTVAGQSNIYNGLYCLLDSTGSIAAGIPCNSTGVFNNVPYGSYCMQVTDGCSGAVVMKCFSVTKPVPSIGPAVISIVNCTGFQVKISSQSNLISPSFCLYDSLNNLVQPCNSNGTYFINGFGAYHIVMTDACGTSITTNFSQYKLQVKLDDSVSFSNQTCATFTAAVTGQQNLDNATYYLQDSTFAVVATNSTGSFSNLTYGPYCIKTVSACGDTILLRCFDISPPSLGIALTATPSCTYNASDLDIQISRGVGPYIVNIYDLSDSLLRSDTSSTSHVTITGLPALVPGQQYKIVATGYCGSPVTGYVTAQESQVDHVYTITPKCPSTLNQNGSSDLTVSVSSNLAYPNLAIVSKDGTPTYIGFDFRSGNDFTFTNLDNATYVIVYSFASCANVVNDTLTLPPYQFPNLARSAAYQCDNNSFSVGASVSDGVGPYTYQIIGSQPSNPTINTAPQASPVFTVNNGHQYTLVRLRAIDACGNAALNDVSVLPLANTIVTANTTCIYHDVTLTVDDIPNATYTWFKQDSAGTDSAQVGTGSSLTLYNLMPSDTGTYVNRASVNNGCLTKLSYFHLDGSCNILLPDGLQLEGHGVNDHTNELSWPAVSGGSTRQYMLERKKADGNFETITIAYAKSGTNAYSFTDITFTLPVNQYRVRIVRADGSSSYSNIVQISSGGSRPAISVFPNPVDNVLNISIDGQSGDKFEAALFTVAGQLIYAGKASGGVHTTLTYHREATRAKGVYFLKVNNTTRGTMSTFKVIFK